MLKGWIIISDLFDELYQIILKLRVERKGSKADREAGPFPVASSMPDPSPTAVPEIDEDQLRIALAQLEAAMRSSDQACKSSDETLRQHRARIAKRPG